MRITQHKIKDNNEKCEVKSENHDDDEVTSSSPPKEKPQNLVICGSVTRVRWFNHRFFFFLPFVSAKLAKIVNKIADLNEMIDENS